MRDIVKAEPLDGYRLRLTFDDGVEGEVNVAELTDLTGVFEPLREPRCFRAVRVHQELGTVYWENGADLDPDVLYSLITGRPVDLHTPTGTP